MYCRVPLIDGSENTQERLIFVIQAGVFLVQDRVTTLIACSAGMSRSPAIAAAVVSVLRQRPPDAVLADIMEGAPADVSPGLWAAVKQALHVLQST